MTKTTLFTAVSLATLALAGAANAQVVTSTEVSNIVTKANLAATVTPYALASESVNSAANRRTLLAAGDNVIAFTTSGDGTVALEASTAYRVNFALSGSATPTFVAAVTAAALVVPNTSADDCIASKTLVSGTGATGTNTVSFIVTTGSATAGAAANDATCTTGDLALLTNFTVDVPFQVASVGNVSATISGGLDASNTNAGAVGNAARFTATGATTQLVQSAPGYRIFASGAVDAAGGGVDDADLATTLALGTGTPFRTFLTSDVTIGAAGFELAAAPATAAGSKVYANLIATDLPSPTFNLEVKGNFATLKPQTDTDDAAGGEADITPASGNLSAKTGTLTASQNVKLRIDGSPTTSIATTPQPFTVTVTPVAPAADNTLATPPQALVDQGLETVGLEGTNFIAPWFSGSQAQSQSQVRLSTTGSAVGTVLITIVNGVFNFNGTPTNFNDTMCAQTFSIPADGDLVINTATVTSCFGNFLRGDLQITVRAAPGILTAKMRNTSSNGTFETTLGRASGSAPAAALQ